MHLSYEEITSLIQKEKEKWVKEAGSAKGYQKDHLRKVSFYAIKGLKGLEKEVNLLIENKYKSQ